MKICPIISYSLLQVYDENLSKALRATDLVSFVGILDSEPYE